MFETLDRIIVHEQEVKDLFKWKDNNKQLVRQYRPWLLEGVIELTYTKNPSSNYIYFKHEEHDKDRVKYQFHIGKNKIAEFLYDRTTWKIEDEWFEGTYLLHIKQTNGTIKAMIEDVLGMHSSLMAFVDNYESEVVIKQEEIKRSNKGRSKRKNRYNNVTNLIRTKKYIIPKDVTEIVNKSNKDNKREYERHVDTWTKRGHERKYKDKDGNIKKVIWIEPTVCKAKGKTTGKKKGKTYKLGIDNTQDK